MSLLYVFVFHFSRGKPANGSLQFQNLFFCPEKTKRQTFLAGCNRPHWTAPRGLPGREAFAAALLDHDLQARESTKESQVSFGHPPKMTDVCIDLCFVFVKTVRLIMIVSTSLFLLLGS